MGKYTYYGHDLSYFSRKLESALVFYGADFDRVQVSLSIPSEEARKRAGTHIIPVLETPEGWALWDTTPIMRMLDARFSTKMFASGELGLLIHIIENFLDEWLGRTMVHYRWNYTESAEFAAPLLANGDAQIAKDIAVWGSKACRATGVEPPHQQAMAEAEYERILKAVDAQLQQTRYLMGDAPCAVDTVILGGLRAHTMVDPVPSRLVDNYPRVKEWAAIGGDADGWDGTGAPNGDTGFAQTLVEEMQTAFVPFALANRKALVAGEKAFTATIYGEDVSYLARSYPDAACQMVSDHIAQLGAQDYVKSLGLGALYL